MWAPWRKSNISPSRDRATEVIELQREALEITQDLRVQLDLLESTLLDQGVVINHEGEDHHG